MSRPGRLDGQVALIGGAARGIGAAVARRFAEEGAVLWLNDLLGEELDALVAELREGGATADGFAGDAADPSFVDEWVAGAVAAHGKIDVLYNNVGVSRASPLAETTDEDWRFVQSMTLDTAFYATRAALPHMVARRKGSIISISSGAAFGGVRGLGSYAAAKAGVISLMETVALEHGADGIRANSLTPGLTATGPALAFLEKQPHGLDEQVSSYLLKRLSRPEEVANTVLWLASDESSNVTGICVRSNIPTSNRGTG